jgi:COP9 signalosome complex subunit 2
MGIIHECTGKNAYDERQWADVAIDFFEAFKTYDETGNLYHIQLLRK